MIRGTLGRARSAKDERKALAKIVAWFDRESGKVAGTVNRIAYASATTKSGPAQMDCIDLTANITELLRLFEREQADEIPPRSANPCRADLSSTASSRIRRQSSSRAADGGQWSVDSWTHAYGEAPDIMTIAEWRSRK